MQKDDVNLPKINAKKQKRLASVDDDYSEDFEKDQRILGDSRSQAELLRSKEAKKRVVSQNQAAIDGRNNQPTRQSTNKAQLP